MTVIILMGPQRPDEENPSPELIRQLAGLPVRLVGFPLGDDGHDGQITRAALRSICQDDLGLRVVPDSGTDELHVEAELGRPPAGPDLVVVSQDSLLQCAQRGEPLARAPTVVVCRGTSFEIPYSVHRLIDWRERLVTFTPQPLQRGHLAKELVRSSDRWKYIKENPLGPVETIQTQNHTPSSWPEPVRTRYASKLPLKMEFLVVDDNRIIIKIFEKIMTNLNLSYRIARNGKEAVEAFKANPSLCTCILMDLAMPVIGGMEATMMIREYEKEHSLRPAIIVGLQPGPPLGPLYPGFDFNLRKPITQDGVKTALSSRGIISD